MKKSYVKIDNAISEKSIKNLFKYFVGLINFYDPNFNKKILNLKVGKTNNLTKKLINLKKIKKFSSI